MCVVLNTDTIRYSCILLQQKEEKIGLKSNETCKHERNNVNFCGAIFVKQFRGKCHMGQSKSSFFVCMTGLDEIL